MRNASHYSWAASYSIHAASLHWGVRSIPPSSLAMENHYTARIQSPAASAAGSVLLVVFIFAFSDSTFTVISKKQ